MLSFTNMATPEIDRKTFEKPLPPRRRVSSRWAPLLMSVVLTSSACAENGSSVLVAAPSPVLAAEPQGATTTVFIGEITPSTNAPAEPQETSTTVFTGEDTHSIGGPAYVNEDAQRLDPPVELDCATPDVNLIILGNSTDSGFEKPPGTTWPSIMVKDLNTSPMLNGLDDNDKAVPGQTITRPSPWNPKGDEPRWRLITHVDTVIASVPAEQRHNNIVIIHPSFIDVQDGDVDDAFAIQRAVDGIILSRQKLLDAGFPVIIEPMRPITRNSDEYHEVVAGFSLQYRINGTNGLLAKYGLLPAEYTVPLMGADGYGIASLYEVADGLHPTPEAHRIIAVAMEQDQRIIAALEERCAA